MQETRYKWISPSGASGFISESKMNEMKADPHMKGLSYQEVSPEKTATKPVLEIPDDRPSNEGVTDDEYGEDGQVVEENEAVSPRRRRSAK